MCIRDRDESVQAAIDAKVQKAMPVHWAGFALSYHHSWSEPAEVFVQSAIEKKIDYVLPSLGQLFDVDFENRENWWV